MRGSACAWTFIGPLLALSRDRVHPIDKGPHRIPPTWVSAAANGTAATADRAATTNAAPPGRIVNDQLLPAALLDNRINQVLHLLAREMRIFVPGEHLKRLVGDPEKLIVSRSDFPINIIRARVAEWTTEAYVGPMNILNGVRGMRSVLISSGPHVAAESADVTLQRFLTGKVNFSAWPGVVKSPVLPILKIITL